MAFRRDDDSYSSSEESMNDGLDNFLYFTAVDDAIVDEEEVEKKRDIEVALIGHKLAHFLQRFEWYMPRDVKKKGSGNLDMAWDYFQRFTLPRRYITEKGDKNYIKADPGDLEKESKLYNPFTTPEAQLGNFGVGIGVYFASLRILAIVCFLAGLLYVPAMLYYGSDKYTFSQFADLSYNNVSDNRFSAMCPNTTWVPCQNCTNFDYFYPQRLAYWNITITDPNNQEREKVVELRFAKKNNCDATTWKMGINHIALCGFLAGCILYMGNYQMSLEQRFDEDNLTASDYSIKVMNPPKDALLPEEWRKYFSQIEGAIPVYVTVAIDNDELLKTMNRRRSMMIKLSTFIKGNVNLANMDEFEAMIERRRRKEVPISRTTKILRVLKLAHTFEDRYQEFMKLTEKCEELMKKKYNAASVFVSFEFEAGQRRVLEALSLSTRDLNKQNTQAYKKPEYAFRGKHVLHVREAYEPSTVRWADQSTSSQKRLLQRIYTYTVMILILLGDITIITWVFAVNVVIGAYCVSFLNVFVPWYMRKLTLNESHTNNGTFQTSIFIKIAAFRWINTAIALMLSIDFTQTLAVDGLLPKIRAIFIADITTAPTIALFDVLGNFRRHFLAPRQYNQSSMNLMFRGVELNIAERYANMTKIMFVSLFYAVIFPFGFVFSGIALTVQYCADRFLLMRTWRPLPNIGNEIAEMSCRFFLPGALIIIFTMQTYYWTHFPFDNLCESEDWRFKKLPDHFIGNFKNKTHDHRGVAQIDIDINITKDTKMHEPCFQYILQYPFQRKKMHYPPVTLKKGAGEGFLWMDDEQRFYAKVYAVASNFVVVLVCIMGVQRGLIPKFMEYFYGGFETDEVDSGQRYTDQPAIAAYVPMMVTGDFEYPLLSCDVSAVNPRNIGWKDPFRDYEYYSLFHDAERIKSRMKGKAEDLIFSEIAYYGPNESASPPADDNINKDISVNETTTNITSINKEEEDNQSEASSFDNFWSVIH